MTSRIAVLAAAVLMASATVVAQEMPGMGRRDGSRLDLTDAQTEQIEKLRTEQQKSMIDVRAGLERTRLELRELFRVDQPDRSAIDQKLNDISALEARAQSARVDHWFAVSKILTPEQRKVWREHAGDISGDRMGKAMRQERMMRGHRDGPGHGHRQGRRMR